ncbi:shikimate kinase [Tepidibacillus fermentans]|uniref:Shikimate kinase n=1 Tax=Tepidibacillus fermentans TaxID=1281767 RepID=A0A4R3KKI9_9BACI|nr:shikimate kinase [Tepidibacillus fermentans]TCS83990.1 shikimate kinase [Tepidibacillus fermentans]
MINDKQHLIFIGFMGVGKSTIGKELSRQLHLPFIDLDEEIVRRENRTISEIFQSEGESFFRKVESEIFADIVQNKKPSVIATGGGIILSDQNRSLMKPHLTILLEASLDSLFDRVTKQQQDRPLLKTDTDMKLRMKELYHQRLRLYRQSADFIILTDNKSVDSIIEEIQNKLGLK